MRELIDAYTPDGAYTIFEDARRGMLTEGKLADVVIVANDVIPSRRPSRATW